MANLGITFIVSTIHLGFITFIYGEYTVSSTPFGFYEEDD